MTSIAEKYAARWMPNGEVSLADLIRAAVDEAQSVPDNVLVFLKEVAAQKPEKPDYWSSCGQCSRNQSDAEDILDSLAAELASLREKAAEADELRKDAERYRKLRGWMSSKAKEDWYRVTELSGVFCYVSWEAGDSFLDGLPECNVGLMQKDAAIAQERQP